ncbi:hypothetical protein SAMD00019534_057890 [Acytostelium subglobosum LB1]|uniref:hypothetical protein n=1 Tax=Acytostelium subglobosum LB1 TaxID=1410327 RepID=UPI000644CEDF|nr:hypothetical protein SAMD00019534_057890 [Acytostelium subglobosum LB1]GAM22614.1 hypothetical protein SAMD00019534_057890 [Acytostelium subglobosum LB1]|eukprot:XP_012754734.1 hypothetical protein SAMD00019534_057890 [Acytostelium subglobosum LB1]
MKLLSTVLVLLCLVALSKAAAFDCEALTYDQCSKYPTKCFGIKGKHCCPGSDDVTACQTLTPEVMSCTPNPRLSNWCLASDGDVLQLDVNNCRRPDGSFIPLNDTCARGKCPAGFQCVDEAASTSCKANKRAANQCCGFRAKCVPNDIPEDPSPVGTIDLPSSDNFVSKTYPKGMVIPTCSSLKCHDSLRCIEDPTSGARCVASCSSVKCPNNTKCVEITSGRLSCVSACSKMKCPVGTECVDDPKQGGKCQPLTCKSLKCDPGTKCVDNDKLGATCESLCASKVCPDNFACAINDTTNLPWCRSTLDCTMVTCDDGMDCVENEVEGPYCQKPVPKCASVTCDDGMVCIEDSSEVGTRCVFTNCSMQTCDEGQICVINASTSLPQCVPKPTCANTECTNDTYCKEEEDGPKCVPKLSCSLINCGADFRCVDDPEKGASCIQKSILSCSVIKCLAGYACINDPVEGAKCRKSATPTTAPTKPPVTPKPATKLDTGSDNRTSSDICRDMYCPIDTICMNDESNGGWLCAPVRECSQSYCKTGFECFADSSRVGSCRRITCSTLNCQRPLICHSTKNGVPECAAPS